MADPLPHDEPDLSASMRVQRGFDTAQDLINAFPALEQAALNSSAAGGGAGAGLTEQDRRRLGDLPDAEEEAANIRRVSTRSRAELVSTVLSHPEDLSDAELELVRANFWADVTPQEVHRKFEAMADATPAVRKRVAEASHAAQLTPGEWTARSMAGSELYKRRQRREDEETAARLGALQRHTTPAWMTDLVRQLDDELRYGARNRWGFIALYDAEAQETTSDADRDRFERTLEDVLRHAMANNGAKATTLARRWRLHFFDVPLRPSTANDTATSSPDEPEGDYHSTLRSAFRAVLESPEWFNILEWDHGLSTDMFLVIDKECINSVLGYFLDDMRIRAYEANFPQADRSSYPDGYEGWTWVRLEQLVYRFYGAACTRDDVKMHDIWRAAQASRHKAFVSLDPEVAQGWSTSSVVAGQRQPQYDVHF
jgi:hypothetical protein